MIHLKSKCTTHRPMRSTCHRNGFEITEVGNSRTQGRAQSSEDMPIKPPNSHSIQKKGVNDAEEVVTLGEAKLLDRQGQVLLRHGDQFKFMPSLKLRVHGVTARLGTSPWFSVDYRLEIGHVVATSSQVCLIPMRWIEDRDDHRDDSPHSPHPARSAPGLPNTIVAGRDHRDGSPNSPPSGQLGAGTPEYDRSRPRAACKANPTLLWRGQSPIMNGYILWQLGGFYKILLCGWLASCALVVLALAVDALGRRLLGQEHGVDVGEHSPRGDRDVAEE
ncbi:hypothetical protein THAOC_25057, partial [Thalassiosira oceanica]